ncbi:MAG: DUF4136 domain-containing protein [Epsilonproteobacteria bacterium]|nr:DUF4136 domain-containing protein [Campylobacterota bacterium]
MFVQILLTATTILLMISGCAKPQVDVDYDPAFRPESVATFTVTEKLDAKLPPLDMRRVRRAVTVLLKEKGYRPDPPGDFTARIDGMIVQDVPSHISFGFGVGSYGPHGGGGLGTSVTPTEDKLSLRLDMIDNRHRRIFWSASLFEKLPDFKTPEERARFFYQAVEKLLRRFPPKP